MRLYTLNKRHFALVFLCFVICFSVTVIIGLAGRLIVQYVGLLSVLCIKIQADSNVHSTYDTIVNILYVVTACIQ